MLLLLFLPNCPSFSFLAGRIVTAGVFLSLSLLFNFAYFSRPVTSSFNKDEKTTRRKEKKGLTRVQVRLYCPCVYVVCLSVRWYITGLLNVSTRSSQKLRRLRESPVKCQSSQAQNNKNYNPKNKKVSGRIFCALSGCCW